MIDPITQYILNEIQKQDIIYHAASLLTKTLVPRKSIIGSIAGIGKKEWNKKAIFAATEKNQAIPFGLERINMLFPFSYTEEEVNEWNKACFLTQNKKDRILEVHYYNHTPKDPVYLYQVNSSGFKQIMNDPTNMIKQWYSTKVVTPITVEKLYPKQVKESWKRVSKIDWEKKKQKYKTKGWYSRY